MRWSLAAVAIGAAVQAGCYCTLVGADEGLFIRFDWPTDDDLAPPGDYTVIAVVDGHELSVDLTVSVPGESGCGGQCVAVVDLGAEHLVLDATAWEARIGFQEADHLGPMAVLLQVRSGGEVLGQGFYMPRYQLHEPNGSDCDPHAWAAEDTLALSMP
jgi:hypothetical protein